MLGEDNCFLSSCYPCLSSSVINDTAGKFDESSKIMRSILFIFWWGGGVSASFIALHSSLHYRAYCIFFLIPFKEVVLLQTRFSRPPAGTLSVCVSEKPAEPLLHTAALQFLCAIFTEEAKLRSREVTNTKRDTSLSNILQSPAAGELCELLLQVGVRAADG